MVGNCHCRDSGVSHRHAGPVPLRALPGVRQQPDSIVKHTPGFRREQYHPPPPAAQTLENKALAFSSAWQ
jgi:hypothetical protein